MNFNTIFIFIYKSLIIYKNSYYKLKDLKKIYQSSQ